MFNFEPVIFCLFLILILGISHGALDNIKGKKLLKLFGYKKTISFYLAYLLISLLIIIFWSIFPNTILLLFLIVASYHFGKEDTQFLIIKKSYLDELLFFIKGTLIILAPIYFHFEETINIFKLLLVDNENFYNFLNYIETNKILLLSVILSTLAHIILFSKNFEIKKFSIFLDYFSILILNYFF